MDTAYYNGKKFSFAGCVREPSALPQAAPFRPGEIPDVSKLQANAGKEFSFFKDNTRIFSHPISKMICEGI